jgi:hypothetical protein
VGKRGETSAITLNGCLNFAIKVFLRLLFARIVCLIFRQWLLTPSPNLEKLEGNRFINVLNSPPELSTFQMSLRDYKYIHFWYGIVSLLMSPLLGLAFFMDSISILTRYSKQHVKFYKTVKILIIVKLFWTLIPVV